MVFILPIIAVLVLGWVALTFNTLTRYRNRTENALSDIDVQLKRRYDLVPNLVETVKGYREHEAGVLEDVTRARSAAMNVSNGAVALRGQAETALSGALKSLFAVAENYPDLKASGNFQQLQTQLAALEDDIQSARRYYNAAVREMNNAVQVFPRNIIAPLLGFKKMDFFGAAENEREAVNVSFDK